ncbi:hypothetical protein IWZ01DRAFT_515898 [Phyllosticta capitalensis]
MTTPNAPVFGGLFVGPSGPFVANMPSAPTLPLDTLTHVASTAADSIIDTYHDALKAARGTLPSFYVPPATAADGKKTPNILWNGNSYNDGEAFREAYEEDMPGHTYYDVQSVDAQVLTVEPEDDGTAAANTTDATPNGEPAAVNGASPPKAPKKEEDRVRSILVQASGFVRLQEHKDGPQRAFSETIVLVRNPAVEKDRARGLTGDGRRWLIQSQVFRYIV